MKKIILVIFILLLCGCSVELGYDYYEYIDLDGEKRKAVDCWKPYGNMICELKDGTQIQVKSYRGINYER